MNHLGPDFLFNQFVHRCRCGDGHEFLRTKVDVAFIDNVGADEFDGRIEFEGGGGHWSKQDGCGCGYLRRNGVEGVNVLCMMWCDI